MPKAHDPQEAARLTKSKLIAIKRLMARDGWKTFFDLLAANFPLDEASFVRNKVTGTFEPIEAAKRDGQRDVLLFIRGMKQTPTPGDDDDTQP